jgi:hypothetical protein
MLHLRKSLTEKSLRADVPMGRGRDLLGQETSLSSIPHPFFLGLPADGEVL